MAEQTPANPQGNTPAQVSMEEIDFLKNSGEDVSDLMPDLEAAIQALRSDAPEPTPSQPQSSPETPKDYSDWTLPINAEGEEIKLDKTPAQSDPVQTDPQSPPQESHQQTAQEAALDPYAANAPAEKKVEDQEPEDSEPGEMVIDKEGKLRDAKTGRYVPHQALHAERVRRKEVETEAQKLRDENSRAQERLNMLTEIMQGQQQAAQQPAQTPENQPTEEEKIDPEKDIFGAYYQLEKRYEDLSNLVKDIRTETKQTTQSMQMTEQFRQDATRFTQNNPDFPQAWRYLVDTRKRELEVLGYNDPRAIDAQLASEQSMLMRKAYGDGGSPSDLFYKMAVAKGWKKPEPEPETVPATPAEVNKAVQQPAAQPQVNQNAAQKVQNATAGMQANASLSNAGGTGGQGLTVSQLANMSEDDFVDLVAKLGRQKFDKMLSGGI